MKRSDSLRVGRRDATEQGAREAANLPEASDEGSGVGVGGRGGKVRRLVGLLEATPARTSKDGSNMEAGGKSARVRHVECGTRRTSQRIEGRRPGTSRCTRT